MRLKVEGALAQHAVGLAEDLAEQGYSERSIAGHLRVLAHLDKWLVAQGLAPEGLTDAMVDRYLEAKRPNGQRRCTSRRGFAPVLDHLRTVGAVPPLAERSTPTPFEPVLACYRRYLAEERKLMPATVVDYEYYAGLFLSDLPAPVRGDLARVRAADVVGVVRAQCQSRGQSWVKNFTTALRSLLRFLFLEGRVPCDLTGSVLPVAGWRRRRLPMALGPAEVGRLLASCGRPGSAGTRDLAIVTLALRLGLRAAEIAALQLGDIDWREGEVTVHGKGGRLDRLPLPVDVGEQIVDYLRHERPPTSSRSLFIKAVSPRVGISSKTVEGVVQRASQRAGLAPIGPHRLRHTAATQMLRAGAALAEIGQALRHEHAQTTAQYAKVDLTSLAALAMPWPEVTA